jgi:hypothetical protein
MVPEMTQPATASRTSQISAVISFLYRPVPLIRKSASCASSCGFAQDGLDLRHDCVSLHLSSRALLQRNSLNPSANGLLN